MDAEVDAIPTNDELWEKEDIDFSIHMQTKYEGLALTPPECLYKAESVDELARIIDYYAFYQVNAESFERGTFRVELDFAHKYADYVIKDVYWYCELIRSAVGISGYFETNSSHLVITLTPYDIASKTSEKETTPIHRYDSLIEYVSGSTLTARDQDFDGFAYYEKYAGRYITVWNSQQLWYALEHEYIPIPVADSPAEKVLERAKEILREIVKEGMTIEEKIFVIYSWYGNNVVYDHESYDSVVVEDRKNFPDSLVAELRSFHAEGALLDNLGVCCSCAKSALIMMRLEGIEAYRVILHAYEDNAIDNLGRSDYGSHAIISLRASDGKFYYCDVQQARSGPDLIYKKYHQLLVTAEEQCPYNKTIDRIWNHLDYGKEFPTNLLWNKLEYNGNNLLISTEEELDALLDDYLSREGEKKHINVFVHSLTFSITDLLDANGSVTYHLTASYGGFEEYVIIIS